MAEAKSKAKSEKEKSVKPLAKEKLAVLKLGGGQHLVREGSELEVNHLPLKEGEKGKIDTLILRPKIGKGSVTYKLLEQKKGPKVLIMKYKAKSRYRRKRGFRADLSRILVEKITVSR